MAEPSPQRTQVIFQAGTSSRGQYFAAKHAECVFVAGPSAAVIEPWVRKLRARAEAHDREPSDILIYAEVTVIPGVTATEAQAKIADYNRFIDLEGSLAMVGGWKGIDFSHLSWDDPIEYEENNSLRYIWRLLPQPTLLKSGQNVR